MIALIILKQELLGHQVKKMLRENGHETTVFSNGKDAIDFLRTNSVDIIVTEVDIGEIDGWRFSRLIRSGVLAPHQDTPIVLITPNYSERIAETTARTFDIHRVVAFQEVNALPKIFKQIKLGIGNLNQAQNVLVIEDTRDTAHLIERMLKHKFIVDIAFDGESGIKAFKSKEYDIVLLDIMMPGMSGDEVIDVITGLKPNQVVITMTAHGTIDLAELMMEKGATDYIQKPFKAEQLRRICDIASKREDYLVANQQFIAKSNALVDEQQKYESLSKNHYRVLDSLNSIVFELNKDACISYLNKAWFNCTKILVSEAIGQQLFKFVHESSHYESRYLKESIASIFAGNVVQDSIELRLITKERGFIWCEINLAPHFNEENELLGISGTIEDISIRKKAEQRLRHVALHDTLTGIHNRFYFDNELKNLASSAARTKISHALLFLDLDHFKVINDSQGHHQGDLVLKEISRLLSERTRESDILCRIGGDEFAILLTNTSVKDALFLGQDLCKVIDDTSFQFGDKVYKVSCSIGIAEIDGSVPNCEQYLQNADIAMYTAKEMGRNRAHVFDIKDKAMEELKESFKWVQKLQTALSEDNIVLHFQPIINVTTREILCYEALVRLKVDGKLVYPNHFIPALEKVEEMGQLDRHVIGKALKLMHEYDCLKKVAINLSAQAFNDEQLFKFIENKLNQYQIQPQRIIFELTESASLSNITGTKRMVNRLNMLGCYFSIDDFGTGFSTFAYLKQVPATSVKIDGSFVKDMIKDPTDAALVKAIHDTAQALNKTTVAEFVEDKETLEKLSEIGVHYAQGYFIGMPLPIETINEEVESNETHIKESVI